MIEANFGRRAGGRHQRHHHRRRGWQFHRRPQRHRPGVDGPRPLAPDDHPALSGPDRRPGPAGPQGSLLQGPPGDAGATASTRPGPPEQGSWQRTEAGEVYRGTLLEHLLLQQLTAFYDVGEHNLYRLRGADWNDALDMAADRGESVAFTCAYAGNLRTLAALLRRLDGRSPRRQSGADGGTDGAAAPRPGL